MKNKISIETLKNYAIFEALSDDALNEIVEKITSHEKKQDEILILAGETSSRLYFVVEGWFKAEKTSPDGRQQTLRLVGPGEIINERYVFSNQHNDVTIIAMEDARVFSLVQEDVDALLVKYPQFSRSVIKNLAKRITHLLNQVENLSLYPVEVRLARLLLDDSEDGILARPSWRTQSEIALQLGTVLDVVNRNLQKLSKQGIIAIEREKITIIDRKALAEIAMG